MIWRIASDTTLNCRSYFCSSASKRLANSAWVAMHFTQANKRAHDLYMHSDRPLASEDAGEHRDALLGKRICGGSSAAPRYDRKLWMRSGGRPSWDSHYMDRFQAAC